MTRKKSRKIDKIKSTFGAIDKVFVDRSDPHDQSKIIKLESKMDGKFFEGKKQHLKFHLPALIKFKNSKKFRS